MGELNLAAAERILGEMKTVSLGYLYGSFAAGKEDDLSDVDIAVLLDEEIESNLFFGYQISLMGSFSCISKDRQVSVIILNETTPVLKYEVIRYGRLFYKRNRNERVNFEVAAMREYFDTEHMRQICDFYLHRNIKEGYYGFRVRKYQRTSG